MAISSSASSVLWDGATTLLREEVAHKRDPGEVPPADIISGGKAESKWKGS